VFPHDSTRPDPASADATGASYLKFQHDNEASLDDAVARHLRQGGARADVFKIGEALKTLQSAVAANNADAAIAAATALVERLDIDVTANLRRRGLPPSFMAEK